MTNHESVTQRRVLSVFLLAMLNVSLMASLRTLPLVATYGLSALFYFSLVALLFLVPCALVSAELATGWPKEGGIYIWVREALGERWGFLAIWMQWVHNVAWYPVILSFVATTLAYVIDPQLIENKAYVLTMILSSFWGMTLINFLGLKTSTWFSSLGVILGTIAPGLLIIALGFSWVFLGNPSQITFSLDALLPKNEGIGSLVFLAGLFLAFAGLEVTAAHAAEVKNPQKNYPKAILLAALITFVLFMMGSLAIALVLPKHEINLVAGLIEAFHSFFAYYNLTAILPIMAVLLVIGAIAEINSWILGPVKGLHATSQRGTLPPLLKKTNARHVPTTLLLFQALIVTAVSCVFLYMPTISASFWILSALSAQSYLIMYILMFISAIRLRYTQPHVPRVYSVPFKHHGIWFVSCIGILASLFAILIGFVPPVQIKVGSLLFYDAFLCIGLFIMCAIPLVVYQCKKPHW